jgi:hypothetical protein
VQGGLVSLGALGGSISQKRGKTAVAGAISVAIVPPDRRVLATPSLKFNVGIRSMANTPTHYQKGKMDLSEHKATFSLFWALTKWGIILIALTLVLMAYFLT